MFSSLPTLAGGHWVVLIVKALTAFGFMWTANLVILYAC
jgi:hypothetical protein